MKCVNNADDTCIVHNYKYLYYNYACNQYGMVKVYLT